MEGGNAVVECRGWVFLQYVLGQGSLEVDGPGLGLFRLRKQGQTVVNGVVDVDVVGNDLGVYAPALPLVPSPLGLSFAG